MSKRKRNGTPPNRPRSTASSTDRQLPAQSNGRSVNGGRLTLQRVEARSYSGPLPPPEILAAYNEIVPGSAETIIAQFVAQGNHRMDLEKTVIHGDVSRSNWGLGAGFVLAAGTIVGSFSMIYLGKDVIGLAGIVMALGTLATAFVYGTFSRRKERAEKEKLRVDA